MKSEGVAVIAVTHDPLVEEYADRVVELTDGVLVGGIPDRPAPAVDDAPPDRPDDALPDPPDDAPQGGDADSPLTPEER